MAEDPIPASQAKTMLEIVSGPVEVGVPPEPDSAASAAAAAERLPFICSMAAVASARSPASAARSVRSSRAATRKATVAAPKTDSVTPR